MGAVGQELSSNPVYLARKLREVRHFDARALEVGDEELERAVERRLEELRRLSSRLVGLILDCACGFGVDMLALSGLDGGRELVGVDLALEGLRRAREELRKRGGLAHLIQADACSLPLRPNAFDGAIISHMLHHHPLPLIKAILAEVSRALRPGGFLLVREWCPADEGPSLREEVSRFLNELAHLRELLEGLGELGARPEVRALLYEHFPAFGFGRLYSSILRAALESCGLKVLAMEVRPPRKRSVDELLRRIRDRIEGLSLSEAEKRFLLARLEELEEKARLIHADGREDMVLVEAVKAGGP